jgi:hypothetical protein
MGIGFSQLLSPLAAHLERADLYTYQESSLEAVNILLCNSTNASCCLHNEEK